MARAQPVVSALVAIVIGSACAAVLATTAGAAAQEASVISKIDEVGTRSILVADRSGSSFTPGVIGRIEALPDVEWALGFGRAFDVRNHVLKEGGDPIPSRIVVGRAPSGIEITNGRWPNPGEAILSEELIPRLHLAVASGGIAEREGAPIPVVGSFITTDPVAPLTGTVFIAGTDDQPLQSLLLIANRPSAVEPLLPVVLDLIAPKDRSDLVVETSAVLAELRLVLQGTLGDHARRLALVTLAGGLLLSAVTVSAAVSVRRRDFGRIRALGASRSSVAALVIIQTVTAGAIGATFGLGVGVVIARRITGVMPPLPFATGVAALALLSAAVAALVPAVLTAARDPVRVLRVP